MSSPQNFETAQQYMDSLSDSNNSHMENQQQQDASPNANGNGAVTTEETNVDPSITNVKMEGTNNADADITIALPATQDVNNDSNGTAAADKDGNSPNNETSTSTGENPQKDQNATPVAISTLFQGMNFFMNRNNDAHDSAHDVCLLYTSRCV